MLYHHEQNKTEHITGNIIAFGQPVPHQFVMREKPKICPPCLAEQNYLQKIWELVPVTACPRHQCLLIDYCPQCGATINWSRPAIHLCICEFDYRQTEKPVLESSELRFTKYLYQRFALPFKGRKVSFSFPLDILDVEDLIILLMFTASLFAVDNEEYSGNNIKYANNAKIHGFLINAVKVFDNWAKNYYELIAAWKKADGEYFIKNNKYFLSKIALPKKYGDFELFNQLLHHHLEDVQHYFMFSEFENFLTNYL